MAAVQLAGQIMRAVGILIILALLVIVGAALWLHQKGSS